MNVVWWLCILDCWPGESEVRTPGDGNFKKMNLNCSCCGMDFWEGKEVLLYWLRKDFKGIEAVTNGEVQNFVSDWALLI